jgi:hypothetical protein
MYQRSNTLENNAFGDRRVNGERRESGDRRANNERRYDFRDGSGLGLKPKTIKIWIRSITRTRLGVDRRKGDRRRGIDRRQTVHFHALLTRDEISDLLSL